MSERARQRAEQELNEGRRLLEAGDVHGALKPLERARKDFLQADELDGLRELRAAVEDGYGRAGTADEAAYERLLYASAQNVRYLSRRRAADAKVPWEDPHPELEQPGRPEIRVDRSLTRGDRRWIAVAAVLAAVAVALVAVALVAVYRAQRVVLVNDTPGPVDVGVCDTRACDTVTRIRTVQPRERVTELARDFKLTTPGGRTLGCIHAHGATRLLSRARPC